MSGRGESGQVVMWWYGGDSPHLGHQALAWVVVKTGCPGICYGYIISLKILQLLRGLVAEQARLVKTCQSSVWVAKLMLDQTVGCSTREGVYFWVNWRYCDRYRLGHQPVISQLREGSMYSQAYISIVFGTLYPLRVSWNLLRWLIRPL